MPPGLPHLAPGTLYLSPCCSYLPARLPARLPACLPTRPTLCAASEPRLRYFELAAGSGATVKEGSRVLVHYQCKYRGLSVVDTLSARVLGGNRTVAEVRRRGAGWAGGGFGRGEGDLERGEMHGWSAMPADACPHAAVPHACSAAQ